MARTRTFVFTLLLAGLLLTTFAARPANAQLVGGTIAGDLIDAKGAAVGGAEVLIQNAETGGSRPSGYFARWKVFSSVDFLWVSTRFR